MVTAVTVAESIRGLARGSRPLRVFWVTVSGDRNDFAGELKRVMEGDAVVIVVLRTRGFVDPNAVMKDVADILESARSELWKVAGIAREAGGVDLVLLSRKSLSLVDTSSPIALPDWFPVEPEQTVMVRIADVTWSAAVSLSDESVGVEDLRRILYDPGSRSATTAGAT